MQQSRKHVSIKNLINKARKMWCSILKKGHKVETVETYIKLTDSVVTCKCWGNSISKKDIVASKYKRFRLSICKQILRVKQTQVI